MGIFRRGIDHIMSMLNVTNVIRLLGDIEKLKYFLLTRDQLLTMEHVKYVSLDQEFEETRNFDLRSYILFRDNFVKTDKGMMTGVIERLHNDENQRGPTSDKLIQAFCEFNKIKVNLN